VGQELHNCLGPLEAAELLAEPAQQPRMGHAEELELGQVHLPAAASLNPELLRDALAGRKAAQIEQALHTFAVVALADLELGVEANVEAHLRVSRPGPRPMWLYGGRPLFTAAPNG